MYDGGKMDRVRGVFAVWDRDKAGTFMEKPGGVAHGWFPKGAQMPVFASYRWPTPEDGKRSEEWHGCIPGLGFQLGRYRWESGLTWLIFRRVQWPHVAGREPWSPPVPTIAERINARIRRWFSDMRREPVVRLREPTF